MMHVPNMGVIELGTVDLGARSVERGYVQLWRDAEDAPGVQRGYCCCGAHVALETLFHYPRNTFSHGEVPLFSTSWLLLRNDRCTDHPDETGYRHGMCALRDALAQCHTWDGPRR